MIVGVIVGDRTQNIISSFWSTFLFSGPPSGVLPDLQSGIKNVRPFRALRICNPPLLDDKKGFAILLAADCKSAGLKEVGAFLDDGLQIRRNEISKDFETNILISQEKMGDNIKKVANLFVISDFCSIFANAKLHSAILKASFLCTLNFGG